MHENAIPDNLLVEDIPNTTAKIEEFHRAGAGLLQVVFDFDRTLTVVRPSTNGDITTWHIMNEHLPQAGKEQYQALFEHYRALELDGTMNELHAQEWWSGILNLFVEHRVDMKEVEQDFLSKATIRPGTKALFDLCEKHSIPTIIMSAGIKDVIDIWAQAYDVQPTIVLSTNLQLDEDRQVVGWDKASLVHSLNKHEIGHPELTKIRASRTHTILVGDNLNDADMAQGDDNVFRIRIHDPRPDEKDDAATIATKTFQRFDAMIETGNLLPAYQLVERIVELR